MFQDKLFNNFKFSQSSETIRNIVYTHSNRNNYTLISKSKRYS